MDNSQGDANGKRRRENASSAQPLKKMKLTPLEAPAEEEQSDLQELEERVVREQRKQLLLKNKELKRENQDLVKKIQETKVQAELSQCSLAIVTRYWNNLNDDLILLCKKDFPQQANANLSIEGASSAVKLNANFLQQLLGEYDECIHEDEIDRIEKALVEKCKKSKEILSLIMQGLLSEKLRNDELAKKLCDDSIAKRDTALQSAREAKNTLQSKIEYLEKVIAELRNEKGSITKELQPLSAKVVILQKENDSLRNEVEDLQASMQSANRRIDNLRIQVAQKAKQEMMDLSTPTSAKSLVANDDSQQPNAAFNDAASSAQLEELQKQLNKAFSESESLRTQCAEYMNRVAAMERAQTSEEFVRNSAIYKSMQAELQSLNQIVAAEQQKNETWRLKADQVTKERRALFEEKEKELEKFKLEIIAKLQAKEREIVDMKAEVVASDARTKAANALAEEAASYRVKFEEASKKLTSMQEEFNHRSKDFATLDVIRKKLKDARKSDELAKKAVKDLTIRLDTIKNMNQETRELFELKASEQKYRERAKSLEEEINKLKQDAQDVKKLEELQNDVASKADEVEVLNTEIEKAWQSFDDIKNKHDALMESFKAKEDEVYSKIREQVKQNMENGKLQKEIQTLQDNLKRMNEMLQEKNNEQMVLQQRIDLVTKLANDYAQGNISIARLHDKLAQTVTLLSNSLASERISSSQWQAASQQASQQLNDANLTIKKLESKVKSLQDSNETLQSKYNRAVSANGSAAIDEGASNWKNFAMCSVCNTRIKGCVITRCFHTFCKECVQANLAVRNRKCPTCKKQFDKGDVREIYL